jgi:hypothetical protein
LASLSLIAALIKPDMPIKTKNIAALVISPLGGLIKTPSFVIFSTHKRKSEIRNGFARKTKATAKRSIPKDIKPK